MNIGDRVRIQRDEKRYPSRGSWPQYRGRVASVCAFDEPNGEIGVTFQAGWSGQSGARATWFKPHELTPISEQSFIANAVDDDRPQRSATAPVRPAQPRKPTGGT